MLDIFIDFVGVLLLIMRFVSVSCMLLLEMVNFVYVYWWLVSVGDVGCGILMMVVFCILICLLKKFRLCMYKVGNVYFWKKCIVCKFFFIFIFFVYCIDFCMKFYIMIIIIIWYVF